MKKYLVTNLLFLLVLLTSCATLDNNTRSDAVQIIEVKTSDYLKPQKQIPLTAVIQPSDLTISPIIDIQTLRAEEERATSDIASSTLVQQDKKEELAEAFKEDKTIDVALKDSEYGEKTSGQLAKNATENAFRYINTSSSFIGAIATYDYIEGQIYEIITSPKAITDFRLKPGELIAGQPIVSNSGTSWNFSMGTSIENGTSIQHLFIKPTTVGLDTSMILLTNERTYYFRIASFENSYMTALRFNYPIATIDGNYVNENFEQFIKNSIEQQSSNENYKLDMSKADYNYVISRYKGRPAWLPQNCFSDDNKTYIQFPITIQQTDDMPSVYIESNGEESLVNYRIMGNLYQLDTVISTNQKILLKSSQKEQVRITKVK